MFLSDHHLSIVVHCFRSLNFKDHHSALNFQSLDQFVNFVGQNHLHQWMLKSHYLNCLLLFHHLVLVGHPDFTTHLGFLLLLVPLGLRFQIAQHCSLLHLRRLHCLNLLSVPILLNHLTPGFNSMIHSLLIKGLPHPIPIPNPLTCLCYYNLCPTLKDNFK